MLNATGVLSGLDRPPDVRRLRWWAGGVLALCLLGWQSLVPNSPVRAAAARLMPRPTPMREITRPVRRADLAPYEPERGCLLGAFVLLDQNIGGSMRRWEQLTGKGHSSYLRYLGYGKPAPKQWIADVRRLGAVPNLALEPNNGIWEVHDDHYLRGLARGLAESGGPVFLRFASEMNGTWTQYAGEPEKYRERFRTVARVMREEAPNVAMVWTPYCTPVRTIPDYYPGDDAVDWVGVNIYSVHHHDGSRHHPAHREDPAELLEPIYQLYAERKPIQISEYAATHTCKACGKYTADFAMDKMIRLYRSLPRRFPRVKMVYWFSWDTISGKSADNNYAVTDDPVILDTYRRLVATEYFLPRIPEGDFWARERHPVRP